MPEILYICYEFPRLSETFVYNEFRELRRTGVGVRALSMDRPSLLGLSPEAREVMAATEYLARPGLARGLGALGAVAARHPVRVVRALWRLTAGEVRGRAWRAYASHLLYAAHAVRSADLGGVGIYHCHFATGPASVGMFLSVLTDRPYTVVAHAYDICRAPVALRVKLRTAAAFVTISEDNRRCLLARYGADADRVCVIHCGVDAVALRELRDAAELASPPAVVSIGRLAAKKGHDVLLAACALLRDRGVAFRCTIVGDGEDRVSLESAVATLALADVVTLAGALSHDETLEVAAAAAVSALACRRLADGDRDGIPVSLMEPMAMGIPVVSTAVGGIPELVVDGVTGYVVPQDDPEALANALQRLLENEALRLEMGAASREAVLRGFDLPRTVAQVKQVLEAAAPR